MGIGFDMLRFVAIMSRVNAEPVPREHQHEFEEEQRNWKIGFAGLKPIVRMFRPC